MLQQEKHQMTAAAAEARKKLTDAEASTRAMAAQSALLERRRCVCVWGGGTCAHGSA